MDKKFDFLGISELDDVPATLGTTLCLVDIKNRSFGPSNRSGVLYNRFYGY